MSRLPATVLALALVATACTRPPGVPDDAGDAATARTPSAADGGVTDRYRLFAEHLSSGDIEALVALFGEDATYRDRTFDFEVQGRAAIRQLLEATLLGFGDRRMEIRRVVTDGEAVVTEWILRGRFAGPILGVAPDGGDIEMEGVSVGVVVGGMIVEHTDYLDRAALEVRLGLRPGA